MVEEKDKQAEERQDEPRLWRPWRPPRRRMGWRVLWAVGMLTAVLTTALLIVALRPEIWKDLLEKRVLTLVALGFSLTAIVVMLAIAGARRRWAGFQGKTVWDFLQLLIVPLMLVAIGLVFSLQQDARQQRLEDQRANAERELAVKNAQDEALQAYLDQMGTLLLERDLRSSMKVEATEDSQEARTLARARTLTVLSRLDPSHKTAVMQFLVEAELVQRDLVQRDLVQVDLVRDEGRDPIIELSGADLSGADLTKAILLYANLSGADLSGADLSNASLTVSDLSDANLRGADLRGAHLSGVDLSDANLSGADLSGADLISTDLRFANLISTDLRGSYPLRADLSGADLRGAKGSNALRNALPVPGTEGTKNAELEQRASSLEGATMPNGQKYEEWLKRNK